MMPRSNVPRERASFLWKRLFPIDYLPGVQPVHRERNPAQRVNYLVQYGFAHREGNTFHLTPKGRVRSLLSHGSRKNWYELTPTEQKRWASLLYTMVERQVRTENPRARFILRDVISRKREDTFSISFEERLELLQDELSAQLVTLQSSSRKKTSPEGERAWSNYLTRINNLTTILTGISVMLDEGQRIM